MIYRIENRPRRSWKYRNQPCPCSASPREVAIISCARHMCQSRMEGSNKYYYCYYSCKKDLCNVSPSSRNCDSRKTISLEKEESTDSIALKQEPNRRHTATCTQHSRYSRPRPCPRFCANKLTHQACPCASRSADRRRINNLGECRFYREPTTLVQAPTQRTHTKLYSTHTGILQYSIIIKTRIRPKNRFAHIWLYTVSFGVFALLFPDTVNYCENLTYAGIPI